MSNATQTPASSAATERRWHALDGKTIWVAGGTGHLGGPITLELARCGASVVCIDQPGRAASFITQHGLRGAVAETVDLCNVDAVRDGVKRLVEQHGVPDGVVNLVFASSSGKRLEELTAEIFTATLQQALPPTFEFCRDVAERMKTQRRGSIVLFSSMYGVVAPDPRIYTPPMAPNPIDYGANKAAILQMTRYFAVHYGPANIRFNAITPGPFPNPRIQAENPGFIERLSAKTALGRVGQSQEIVGPTLFLLSDSASFVTGHSLVVDGGWTTW